MTVDSLLFRDVCEGDLNKVLNDWYRFILKQIHYCSRFLCAEIEISSSQYNCLSVEFLYSTSAKSAIWLAELLVHYQLSLLLTHTLVATENGRRSVQWVSGASVMDRRRPQICSNTNLVGAISTFPPVNMDRIGLPMAPQTFHVRFPVLVNHAK